MAACTFDNPATMARECWQDGRLLISYPSHLWMLPEFPIPADKFFFGANIGDWRTGQLAGAREAMNQGRT